MRDNTIHTISVQAIRKLPKVFKVYGESGQLFFLQSHTDQDLEAVWISVPEMKYWIVVRPVMLPDGNLEESEFYNEHAIPICTYLLEKPISRTEWWVEWREFKWDTDNSRKNIEKVLIFAFRHCTSDAVRIEAIKTILTVRLFLNRPDPYLVLLTNQTATRAQAAAMIEKCKPLYYKRHIVSVTSAVRHSLNGTFFVSVPQEILDPRGVPLPPFGYIFGYADGQVVTVVCADVMREFPYDELMTRMIYKFVCLYNRYKAINFSVHESDIGVLRVLKSLHCKGEREIVPQKSIKQIAHDQVYDPKGWIYFDMLQLSCCSKKSL